MAPLLCAQTRESLKLLPGLLLLGGWGTPCRSQRGKYTHRPGPCPVLGEQGGVADPRHTWRLCWMPPTTGQPVWVLDALPLDRLPTDSAETQAHTGLSRWCKTSVYSDFFPRCPGPSGCVLLSGHGGAPQHQEVWGEQGTEVTPSGVGRCPSTRKEGPLATVMAAGTPEGQGALVCIQGCTWSQVCGARASGHSQLHTAHPPARPTPRGPVTGCPGNSPQPCGGLEWPTTP